MEFMHGQRPLVRAALCATAITVTLGVAGCASKSTPAAAGGTGSAGATASGSGSAAPSASHSSGSGSGPNGTEGTALTISNGTQLVLMNGTSVNFGVNVNDLSWSADGSKAVFIDGQGNLVMANPDGTDRVELARNPGGQTWSHPTWAEVTSNNADQVPGWTEVIFAVKAGGVETLEEVPSTAPDGTPKNVSLSSTPGQNSGSIPQTGNSWPSGQGVHGNTAYQNDDNGTDTVYIIDNYLRDITSDVKVQGSDPSMDADGTLVFVRQVDGMDHLFTDKPGGNASPVDITPNSTTDCTEPVWSPDESLIAFSTPDGVETVHPDGTAPAMVTYAPGFPAYRP